MPNRSAPISDFGKNPQFFGWRQFFISILCFSFGCAKTFSAPLSIKQPGDVLAVGSVSHQLLLVGAGGFQGEKGWLQAFTNGLVPNLSFTPPTGGYAVGTPFALTPDGKLFATPYPDWSYFPVSKLVVKLNQDGSVDPSFSTADFDSRNVDSVSALAVQGDGRVVVAFGEFRGGTLSGLPRRLNADGSSEPEFDPASFHNRFQASPGFGGAPIINAMQTLANGKILIAGQFEFNFSNDEGFSFHTASMARLNPDGSVDTTFEAICNPIDSIAIQPDGKILVAGKNFQVANGFARRGAARLNPDGTLDGSFNLGPGSTSVSGLALQSDGRIVLSRAGKLLRVYSGGALDDSFRGPPGRFTIFPPVGIAVDLKDHIFASISDGTYMFSGKFRVQIPPAEVPLVLEEASSLTNPLWTFRQLIPPNTEAEYSDPNFPVTSADHYYRVRPAP